MRTRLVFVSLLCGVLGSQILQFIFKEIWPGYVTSRFANAEINPALAGPGYGLAAILCILGAYIAVRLEWPAGKLDAMRLGALSGFLYGCTAYLFSNASAAAGLMGQREIIRAHYTRIVLKSQGLQIMAESILETAIWMVGMLWFFSLAGIFLGTLGGILANLEEKPGWGKPPAWKGARLSRAVNSILALSCIGAFIMGFGMYSPLEDTIKETIGKYKYFSEFLGSSVIVLVPAATQLLWLGVCAYLKTGWLIEDWFIDRQRLRAIFSLLFFGLMLAPIYFSVPIKISYIAYAVIGTMALFAVLVKLVRGKKNNSVCSLPKKFNFFDLLAAALVTGLLTTCLSLASIISYAISLAVIAVKSAGYLTLSSGITYRIINMVNENFESLQTITLAVTAGLSVAGLILIFLANLVGLLRQKPRAIQEDYSI
jgi:hypothetical protein